MPVTWTADVYMQLVEIFIQLSCPSASQLTTQLNAQSTQRFTLSSTTWHLAKVKKLAKELSVSEEDYALIVDTILGEKVLFNDEQIVKLQQMGSMVVEDNNSSRFKPRNVIHARKNDPNEDRKIARLVKKQMGPEVTKIIRTALDQVLVDVLTPKLVNKIVHLTTKRVADALSYDVSSKRAEFQQRWEEEGEEE
jgi:carboxylesterase type B